ncbi:MAG: peptidoglycan-binding domain-containing protein, partial [Clostridiales bacterium]|nr:peptidoglycan-binding domain-containing protein [Clostridiales bacterium]
ATWYKIIYLYGGITRLSELRSQGQRFYSVEFSQQLPETLQQGDTGRSVEVLQYWLALDGQFNDAIPNLVIDGVFGPTTYQAVRAFQAWTGLPVTGVVDQSTWDYLYRSFRSIADLVLNNELLFPPIQRVTGNSANDYSTSTRGQQFPGRSLELGSSDMEGGT